MYLANLRYHLGIILIAASSTVYAQGTAKSLNAQADSILSYLRLANDLDVRTKSELADSAFHISVRSVDTCRQIAARITQAGYLDEMAMADSALAQLYWASRIYTGQCDSLLLIRLMAALTNVYLSLGEDVRIDSVSRIALALWNPKWEDKENRLAILNNLGIARFTRGEGEASLDLFRQAYEEALAANNTKYIQRSLLNLGTLKGATGDLDSAYYFLSLAADKAGEVKDMNNLMSLLINLANVDMYRAKYASAEEYLDSVQRIATTLNSKESLTTILVARADLAARQHRFKEAYEYQKEFADARTDYLDEERVKSVTEMMEKYETEKKERQIQELEIEKLNSDLKTTRLTAARNRTLFAGIAILIVAIGLFSRLRYVRRAQDAIRKEKDVSDNLLLNILPSTVADELKATGHAHARHYSTATIMFSDFREFTVVSQELTPTELVEELNICFQAFDEITTKYGIEKIKTIGDAYMSAGGLPDTNLATVADVVRAGLDMQDFVKMRKVIRRQENKPEFEMRLGVHTGPVVAGIVGVKKFQYDLWGDTVNVASRMETTGAVDRVNISHSTYALIRDNPEFRFTPRGRIEVKGKGDMEMYFVDRA